MPKRDYKQFCPTARALNVVGERWTLLIVRDLLIGPRRYTDLRRGLPGMASNLLAVRLAEMEEAGLVAKTRVETPSSRDLYVLTERGRSLEAVLLDLARFGFPLLGAPTDEQPMIAERVPLALRAMMHEPELPDGGLRIRFDLAEGDHLITIEPQGPPGSRRLPGERVTIAAFDEHEQSVVDVTGRGSIAGLLWIQQGLTDLERATRDGLLVLSGDTAAQRTLRHLYRLDPARV